MKPGNVMVRPVVENSAFSPVDDVPAMRTVSDWPRASVICEATVRCQISSYSRSSSPPSSRASSPGVRHESPAGRIASCASWAFLTFFS